jgi:hypothetical protein
LLVGKDVFGFFGVAELTIKITEFQWGDVDIFQCGTDLGIHRLDYTLRSEFT